MQAIVHKLEDVAASLVALEPEDATTYAELQARLSELATLLGDDEREVVRMCAETSCEFVQQLPESRGPEAEGALGVLSQAISALQQVLRDGRSVDEVVFPEWPATGSSVADAEPLTRATPESPSPSTAATPPVSSLAADPALVADFVCEAQEHLDAADQHLLVLETDSANHESLHAVFRVFHTIKGVSSFLGFDAITHLAHEAENLLDRVRGGQMSLEGQPLELTFASLDELKRQVEWVGKNGAGAPIPGAERRERLIASLRAMGGEDHEAAGDSAASLQREEAPPGEELASAAVRTTQRAPRPRDRPSRSGAAKRPPRKP